ncbi:Isochorismatase domain-containing protein [Mucor velutinosus]|uniref:ATP-dependent DNA helicase n=1 Tax=Mucor velutinosus TaxID=708070 RepID=A0AAN7DPF2_9FUNG|nr:Isochorismatase domain-containing protein [Mucor velutinosus]
MQPHYLGRMDVVCDGCGALHWDAARTTGQSRSNNLFYSCCKKGKAILPLLQDPPEPLNSLINGSHPRSSHFLKHIRQYNTLFAFTSFGTTATPAGAQREGEEERRGGVTPVSAHGELYHMQAPLNFGNAPKYNQLYIYDPEYAAACRSANPRNQHLDDSIIEALSEMIDDPVRCGNPFVRIYKHAHEILSAEEERQAQDHVSEDAYIRLNPQMRLELVVGEDRRTQNLPTVNEIAAIIPNEYADSSFRDILITYRNSTSTNSRGLFRRINETHAAYMPLHYVLLFPRGEYGWHWGLRLQLPASTVDAMDVDNEEAQEEGQRRATGRLTQRAFYRFRLHVRNGESKILFLSRRLFQQYLIDAWAVCEQTKLNWIKANQTTLRADVYKGLADAISASDTDLETVGRTFILPSSFTGGPRFMAELYQNAMAISRFFGKPTLFITFTANPNWREIQDELLPGQSAADRPDLVAEVFNRKHDALLKDLKQKKIFGAYKGIVRTIEYQKRGLPHSHMLLFLDNQNDRFDTAERIDQIISTEIPDVHQDPELHAIVTRNMMHGPCGGYNKKSPCMVKDAFGNDVCSKKFPKPYQPATIVPDDGYPLYRRRMDGRSHVIRIKDDQNVYHDFHMTNEWVVAYNPFLSKRYNAHINVEVCASVQAIKYINKYIYKGSDQTTLKTTTTATTAATAGTAAMYQNDECAKYLNGRYISPCEAVWRLKEFPMHEESPPVTTLAIHLENEQPVYFDPSWPQSRIDNVLRESHTTLMGYFHYNAVNQNKPGFQPLLYQQFPEHMTWKEKKPKRWEARRTDTMSIGRMYYCSPAAGERYYLRLLLTVVRGATSFSHLRTVNNHEYATFREACMMLHLIEDDGEWTRAFEEAATFASGYAMRSMFVSALMFNSLVSPVQIWNQFCESFCDDLEHAIVQKGYSLLLSVQPDAEFYHGTRSLDYGLYLLQTSLGAQDRSLGQFNLPLPLFNWNGLISRMTGIQRNSLILNEMSYLQDQEAFSYQQKYAQMNATQKHIFETITSSINSNANSSHFFLQGPAGTGKTFIYNTLCHFYRSQGKIVLCVASSGIAALLLPGGRTSHSRFAIPLNIHEQSVCAIKKNDDLADLIRETSLIIWDEVPMQHRYCFEAFDRTLRDICSRGDEVTFGGIPVVLGGDFAQIPPVVRQGGRPEIVNASLKSSRLWPKLQKLSLTENMRLANSNDTDRQFADWIGKMSYEPSMIGSIALPSFLRQMTDLDQFIEDIYPQHVLQCPLQNSDFFKERAILCSKNVNVDAINSKVMENVIGEKVTLYSADTVQSDLTNTETQAYPSEYLQTLSPSGLPPAVLELKVGLPVMLLRNLNPERGLCNGTRLIIQQIGQYVLKVKILGGSGAVELIPRFTLSTLPGTLPFILTRKQFPVKVSFAMTINKSQGQSLRKVAVDLRSPVFTHGQLYVAMSRATSANGMTILLPENMKHTENVVYPEVLFSDTT